MISQTADSEKKQHEGSIQQVDPVSTRLVFVMLVRPGQWSKEDAVKYLEALATERACASCYFVYYKKFLTKEERMNVLTTSKDCSCDYDLCDHPEKNEGPTWQLNSSCESRGRSVSHQICFPVQTYF